MTNESATGPKAEALQAVIDRVVSYEESATPETIRTQLVEGLGEAGVTLDDGQIDRLVQRIADDPEDIAAADYL
ncbi:hypothetical protein [Mariniluteicoccus flavus]